jgi:hypothetical protein
MKQQHRLSARLVHIVFEEEQEEIGEMVLLLNLKSVIMIAPRHGDAPIWKWINSKISSFCLPSPPFTIIALPVCRRSSQAMRGDVYYLRESAGRGGERDIVRLSLFHRARHVHAVDVALVHGDDEHEVVSKDRQAVHDRHADNECEEI